MISGRGNYKNYHQTNVFYCLYSENLGGDDQTSVVLPADIQTAVVLPADIQTAVVLPADIQTAVVLPADIQYESAVVLPANIQYYDTDYRQNWNIDKKQIYISSSLA